ncbi:MAG: epoxyqueuosine reductase QueH [Ruminococcaceae bacterium]|nr:epoxyqueuosine reductase QueH [Oscillospiraceae bacterium]
MASGVLLHICCGPCSLYCIDELNTEFRGEITGYYANPNIHPYDEFMRRKGSTAEACRAKDIPLITEDIYDIQRWKAFKSSCAERCEMCYTVRAELSAKKAAELGFEYYTSTLFVSPYQNHFLMKEIFDREGKKYGVKFLYKDFRDGFRTGQMQAKELGLYRQKYCGCIKSLYGE